MPIYRHERNWLTVEKPAAATWLSAQGMKNNIQGHFLAVDVLKRETAK